MNANSDGQTVVALFADRDSADRAADALLATGVPAASLHLHEKGLPPRNAAGITVDEYATGGFFSNFASLLNGLLEAKPAPGTAASYSEVVQFEGIALSVEVNSAEEAARVEAKLRHEGAVQATPAAQPQRTDSSP